MAVGRRELWKENWLWWMEFRIGQAVCIFCMKIFCMEHGSSLEEFIALQNKVHTKQAKHTDWVHDVTQTTTWARPSVPVLIMEENVIKMIFFSLKTISNNKDWKFSFWTVVRHLTILKAILHSHSSQSSVNEHLVPSQGMRIHTFQIIWT